jgi:CRP/FNR family transcriptional regulator, cyclic AMP receptor protein
MNPETRYWFLHDHQLFNVLDREELKRLCLIPEFKTVKKSEIVFFSHDEREMLYTIKRGIMKIVEIDEQGNETIKDILREGDLFGQFTLSGIQDNNQYAIALTDRVVACAFRVSDFENILEKNPQLAIQYTKLVGLRLQKVRNQYKNLIFKDVETRLRLFLYDWALQETGQVSMENVEFKNYLTHQDIANLICSTRQTVNLMLHNLKEKGLVFYTRQLIQIPDLKKLVA